MKKFIKSNYFLYSLGILLVFFLWFIIAEIIDEKQIIFPGPIETFSYFFYILTLKETYLSILATLYKMFLGYGLSIILALILGILSGITIKVEKVLRPLMITLKAIPTASVIFLFIVIAKFEYAPIYVVMLISFPILYESILGGIKNIPSNINDSIKIDGGDNFKNIFKVKLPMASNYFIVGIASSFALAFKIEIMSEIICGSTGYGIGSTISSFQKSSASMVPIMAYTMLAIIVVLIITLLSNIIKNTLKKKI